YDYEQGKMYKEGFHVEEYVIWLIESKDVIKEQISFWERRVLMLRKALNVLSSEEIALFNDFRQEKEVNRSLIEPILVKLKTELEKIVSFQLFSLIPQPFE